MPSIQPGNEGRSPLPIAPQVELRSLAVHEFARLEPLWLALHEHHVRISPRLAGMPARSARESWARRLASYRQWAREPETFVVVAEADRRLTGYAFVTFTSGYSSWDSGARQASLETLSVAPSVRGQGVGDRLLSAVRERVARAGIETIALSAVCANEGAHRFYERHGFDRAEVAFVGATSGAENGEPARVTSMTRSHGRTR